VNEMNEDATMAALDQMQLAGDQVAGAAVSAY
jgi:hypothetical protein